MSQEMKIKNSTMKKRYASLSTLSAVFLLTSLFYSPAYSQSQTDSGTVYSWGSQVLTGEENIGFTDIVAGNITAWRCIQMDKSMHGDRTPMVKAQFRLAW